MNVPGCEKAAFLCVRLKKNASCCQVQFVNLKRRCLYSRALSKPPTCATSLLLFKTCCNLCTATALLLLPGVVINRNLFSRRFYTERRIVDRPILVLFFELSKLCQQGANRRSCHRHPIVKPPTPAPGKTNPNMWLLFEPTPEHLPPLAAHPALCKLFS